MDQNASQRGFKFIDMLGCQPNARYAAGEIHDNHLNTYTSIVVGLYQLMICIVYLYIYIYIFVDDLYQLVYLYVFVYIYIFIYLYISNF